MKFVILSSTVIPGFNGQRGPLLTPQELDVKSVLKMVGCGIDVREVMSDGSYRKVEFSDDRLTNYLSNKIMKEEMKVKEKPKVTKVEELKTEIKEFNSYKNRDKKKFNNKKEEKPEKQIEEIDDLKENL